MKIRITALLLIAALFLTSCQKKADISGSYTIDGMDSIYTFTSDGKIYVNDETESFSHYEIKGNRIVTYIEGAGESIELPFEKTKDGFRMGQVEYRKLYEPEDFERNTETENDSSSETDAK